MAGKNEEPLPDELVRAFFQAAVAVIYGEAKSTHAAVALLGVEPETFNEVVLRVSQFVDKKHDLELLADAEKSQTIKALIDALTLGMHWGALLGAKCGITVEAVVTPDNADVIRKPGRAKLVRNRRSAGRRLR